MKALLAIGFASISLIACGGDDSASPADASQPSSDSAIDAEVGCLDYQVEVFDWSMGVSVPASETPTPTVTIAEVGNAANSSGVAPNGRASICLSPNTLHRVEFTSTSNHLRHVQMVEMGSQAPATYRVHMMRQADVDGLAAGNADPANGHLIVDIPEETDGCTAAIDATSDAGLFGTAGGAFLPGSTTVGTDRMIIFRNVDPTAGSTNLTISGALPSGPPTLDVTAGETTGALSSCIIGP